MWFRQMRQQRLRSISTHVAQGAAASPWGTQGSFSSSSGHSSSLPIGNCLMIRVRARVPSGDAISWHVFEQGPHSDHSDTWHSLVITQDWKVIGSFSCWQNLQKSIGILITGTQAVTNFLFRAPECKQPGQFYFYLGGEILISLKTHQHLWCVKAVRLKANICIFPPILWELLNYSWE